MEILTERDRLAIWFHEGESDLEASGIYAVVTNTLGKKETRLCWGEIAEFDPPQTLVHTFTHQDLKGVEMTCRWTLAPMKGVMLLYLKHSGFEKAVDGFLQAGHHDVGWNDHFARLRRVVS